MNDEAIKDTYDPLLSIKIEYLRDKLNKVNIKLDKSKSRKNKLLILWISFGVAAIVCLILIALSAAFLHFYLCAIFGIISFISYIVAMISIGKFINARNKQADLTSIRNEILSQIEILNRGFQFSSNIMLA